MTLYIIGYITYSDNGIKLSSIIREDKDYVMDITESGRIRSISDTEGELSYITARK